MMSAVVGLVSREPYAHAITDFLARMADGPVGLAFDGEAGIGKTTLWLEAVERATAAGFGVLTARGSQAEAQSTFAAAADLLRDVEPSELLGLPPVQQAALDAMLLRGAAGAPVEERVLATAFLSVLERLADRVPVLLAIDDVQWRDVASRAVVGFATRRLKGRIGVLVTVRTGDPQADVDDWLRLPNPDAITRLTVDPLSLGAMHNVITSRVGRSLPRITAVRIHEISRGNPFYALELARTAGTRADPAIELPESLAGLVSRRLGDVDPASGQLLLAVATAAEPTIELLSRALDKTPGEVLELVEGIESLGIFEFRRGAVQFVHPLLAHGVYSQAGAAQRRQAHAAMAVAVQDVELRARHLALAATVGDRDTVDALDAAADVAGRRGAPAAAAELLELAIGLGGDTVLRRVRAAELYFRAGSLAAAGRVLPEDVDAVPAGAPRCLTYMLTGAMRAYDDDLAGAVDAMLLGFQEAGENDGLRAICAMRLALALHTMGRRADALDYVRIAVDLTRDLGAPAVHSQALSLWVACNFVHGLGVDHAALQLAVQTEDPDCDATSWFRASAVQAMVTAWTGDLEKARDRLCSVAARMHAGGTELDIIWAANHLSRIDVWLGDYDTARVAAEESLQRATQMGGRQLLMSAWNVVAEAAARSGREADARAAAGATIAAARETGAANMAATPIATLGFLEVSLGNYQAAVATLEPLLNAFDARHDTDIVAGGYLPDAIEALVAVGRVDDAEPLVRSLEDNGIRHDRAWMLAAGARGRAQLFAARGDLAAAQQSLEQALVHHRDLPMPFELARTQLLLGQLQRRRRSRGAAATTLTAALHSFERIGSPLWAARARAELQRTQHSLGDGSTLTDTERHTAGLAAEGCSNREIATAMFQSEKTVEMNLTRVYRKLGIRSRSQLAARMATLDEGS